MSEDFIIDEEGSGGAGNNRAFMIAAGVLTVTLILSAICASAFWVRNRGSESNSAIAQATIDARLHENEIIAVTNTAVAVTIEAMTAQALTAEAIPATNTPAPTFTPNPTFTPIPTETPVVVSIEDTPTPEIGGTTEFAGGTESTPTPIAVAGGNTGNTGGSSNGGGGSETLPQTGIDTWGALLAAFVLIVVVFAARRLRSS